MKNKSLYISLIGLMVFAFIAAGCGNKDQTPRKDRSAGNTSEILVVTQNAEQWNGGMGDSIRAFFTQEQYGLPQPEAIYRLLNVNVSNFSDLFKKHKAILVVEISSKLDSVLVETGKDLWAAPQRVVKIVAPNQASWIEAFEEHKENIKLMYDIVERERIMSLLRPNTDASLYDAIRKKFGFTLTVPRGFAIAKNNSDFMWLRRETDKSSFGIIIYAQPYSDTLQFDASNLISTRDRVIADKIPGPTDGSFMTTEKEFVPPLVNYVNNFPSGYAAEMRGMWCLVGDYMAGPFISYTFAHAGKLVTVEGFVYEPNAKKRDQLLQLQSILFSLSFQDEQVEQPTE